MSTIRIVEYLGGVSPFDGEYVVEYLGDQPSTAPDGTKLPFTLVTTPDPARAHQYRDKAEALEVWRKEYGVRLWDLKPNRPLTAFTVEIAE